VLQTDSKRCGEQKSERAVSYPDVACWRQHSYGEWCQRRQTIVSRRTSIYLLTFFNVLNAGILTTIFNLAVFNAILVNVLVVAILK
jgi:hypothetical protein